MSWTDKEIYSGMWKHLRCKRCGWEMVMDTCGCIMRLCNPPSMEHDWETLDKTLDRNIAFSWRLN